jgi:hypothetical protein
MISIRKSQIPKYLQDSEYYKSIQSDDPFELSDEHYRKEIIINFFEDLIIYIRILDFWLVNKFPDEFYDWVFKNKDKINMDILNEKFTNNNLLDDILIIITSTNDNICVKAACEGNVNLLKYSHENGCVLYEETSKIATIYGHLNCLKYIHENDCEMYKYICEVAAEYGHLDCLKYAHSIGCFWNENTCFKAAFNGKLECLKYAHLNGCEWDEDDHSSSSKDKTH